MRYLIVLLLGIVVACASQDERAAREHGVIITAVAPGSPAEAAGIKAGDKLVYVLGNFAYPVTVMDARHALALMKEMRADHGGATVVVWRNGRGRASALDLRNSATGGMEFAGSP